MNVARRSYLKTVYFSACGVVAAIVVVVLVKYLYVGVLATLIATTAQIAALFGTLIALSGFVVLYRDSIASKGGPDLFLRLNHSRSEPVLAAIDSTSGNTGKFSLRHLFSPHSYVVGELVEVRSWEEIQTTLDDSGALEGVPFMGEMMPYCGQRTRVLRDLDKVYDYGGSKTLRRVSNCVLLAGVRCNGEDHGGCQARCSIFWKTAWLKPVRNQAGWKPSKQQPQKSDKSVAMRHRQPSIGKQQGRFICQYTQIVAASIPMRTWDIRQDIRPLLVGNVAFGAFTVALLTWLFNRVQGLRGGIPFPHVTSSGQSKTPVADKNLKSGELVRVLGSAEIGATLDITYRNRGLWFDREMIKYCYQPCQVAQRVDRIIDDATGHMVPMRTPCILLDNVVASGEFLRFCPQQEYLFWREVWLAEQPVEKGI